MSERPQLGRIAIRPPIISLGIKDGLVDEGPERIFTSGIQSVLRGYLDRKFTNPDVIAAGRSNLAELFSANILPYLLSQPLGVRMATQKEDETVRDRLRDYQKGTDIIMTDKSDVPLMGVDVFLGNPKKRGYWINTIDKVERVAPKRNPMLNKLKCPGFNSRMQIPVVVFALSMGSYNTAGQNLTAFEFFDDVLRPELVHNGSVNLEDILEQMPNLIPSLTYALRVGMRACRQSLTAEIRNHPNSLMRDTVVQAITRLNEMLQIVKGNTNSKLHFHSVH